jgi:hypothetical protein
MIVEILQPITLGTLRGLSQHLTGEGLVLV